MSSHQGTCLHIKPGCLPPEEYLKTALSENKSGIGVVSVKDGKNTVSHACEALDIVDVMAALEPARAAKNEMLMYLANYPEKFVKDDMQPYTVLSTEDDKGLVWCVLDGNFNIKNTSNLSNAFTLASEIISPKLIQFYSMLGDDIDKLMQAMDSSAVHKEMDNLISADGAGTIMLLGINGKFIRYGSSSAKAWDAEWGYTTNMHGWAPAAPKSTVPTAPAKAKGLKGLAVLSQHPAAPPQPTPVPDKPAEVVPITKPADTGSPMAIPATPENDILPGVWQSLKEKKFYAQCPMSIEHKGNRRQWWSSLPAATVPSKFKERPGPVVELPQWTEAIFWEAARNHSAKDTAPHNVATLPEKIVNDGQFLGTKKVSEVAQVLSAEAKTKLDEFLKQGNTASLIAGNEGTSVPTQADMLNVEKAYPTFIELAKASGITFESVNETSKLPFGWYVALAKDCPEGAALLIKNLQVALIKTEEAFEDLSNEVAETTAGSATEPTKQPAAPPAQTQPQPSVKGMKGLKALRAAS